MEETKNVCLIQYFIESLSLGYSYVSRRRDFRTRQSRTQQCVDAFKNVLDAMTDAYMDWLLNRDENKSPSVEEECQSSEGILVVDIFSKLLTSRD